MLNTVGVLAASAAFLVSMASIIVHPGAASPGAFLGAVFFAPLALWFDAMIFLSVFGKNKNASCAAAWLYFALSALATFGVIANVLEPIAKGKSVSAGFLIVFTLTGVAVTAYAVFLGLLSLRWWRKLSSSGPKEPLGGSK